MKNNSKAAATTHSSSVQLPAALQGFKIPLGKDNYDNVIVWDLDNHSTPHVLVCGATGSGKSVSVRSTVEYAKLAGVDKIVIFDPKYEFTEYQHTGIHVYNDISEIETEMANLVEEMNDLMKTGKKQRTLIVFDEFADAVSAARAGTELKVYEMVEMGNYKNGAPKLGRACTGELKSLEENLRVLLQKGRSTGFRIISATQRASVKVITGDAKEVVSKKGISAVVGIYKLNKNAKPIKTVLHPLPPPTGTTTNGEIRNWGIGARVLSDYVIERNKKRDAERAAKKLRGQRYIVTGGTFVGSIRDKFTGPRRNNFQSI